MRLHVGEEVHQPWLFATGSIQGLRDEASGSVPKVQGSACRRLRLYFSLLAISKLPEDAKS